MTAFDFAKNIIAGLDNQIADCADLIAQLEAKLAQVRESQKALENQRQGLLTLAKAGESALSQAANFLRLAESANRTDMVDAFWNGIDELRGDRTTDEPLLQLPEVNDSQPETSEPQPSAPAPTTEPTEPTEETEVVVAEVVTEAVSDAEVVTEAVSDSDENPILTKAQLQAVTKARGKGKAFLKAMAVKYRVSHNSRTTNEQLISELAGKVSRSDVAGYKSVG